MASQKSDFINVSDLTRFARRGKNVMLVGLHGIGKTSLIESVFNAHYGVEGKDWLYFNGATIDAYIHLLGIPKTVQDEAGNDVTRMVPPEQLNHHIRAIYVDEYNRAPKEARNGFMELLQRKSVNGRRFKNLEVVWTSVNPHQGGDYDVEVMDPAQEDRFQAHVFLPYDVNDDYFKLVYGAEIADVAIKWWRNLSSDHQLLCSPRRLREAVDAIIEGDNIKYYLADSLNVTKLVKDVLAEHEKASKKSIIEAMSATEIASYYSAERVIEEASYLKKHQHLFKSKVMPNLSEKTIESLVMQSPRTNGLAEIIIRAGLYKLESPQFLDLPTDAFTIAQLAKIVKSGPSKRNRINEKIGSAIPAMEGIFEKFEPIYTRAAIVHSALVEKDDLENGRSNRMQTAMEAWAYLTADLPDIQSKLIFVLSYARHPKPKDTQMFAILDVMSRYATYEFKSFVKTHHQNPDGHRFLGELMVLGAALHAMTMQVVTLKGGLVGYFNNAIFVHFKAVVCKLLRSKDIRPLLESVYGSDVIEGVGHEMLYSQPQHSRPVQAADDMLAALSGTVR
ncbi:hypothetical protein RYA05_00185 [Pseudomonas syringae pv. actinidiae]|nr:hypothetical protein [Pseudomonas syringae pv. actinidiae]